MRYGEIKALYLIPRDIIVLSLVKQVSFMQPNPVCRFIKAGKVQRLSPDGRVKPEAYAGRKILALVIGMTNSLYTI